MDCEKLANRVLGPVACEFALVGVAILIVVGALLVAFLTMPAH